MYASLQKPHRSLLMLLRFQGTGPLAALPPHANLFLAVDLLMVLTSQAPLDSTCLVFAEPTVAPRLPVALGGPLGAASNLPASHLGTYVSS